MPIICKGCLEEMQQVTQGMTNYEWYKDYRCSDCKITVIKLDKDRKSISKKITERNF